MASDLANNVEITGYRPELATQIIPILAKYFLTQWGHDNEFRKRLANEVQAYISELDNPRNGALCAWLGDKLVGAVAVDGMESEIEGGWIRWFIVDDAFRNSGLGRVLFEKAVEYCKTRGYSKILISTYKNHDPAIGLYERLGFSLKEERDFSTADTQITQLWYEKTL